MKPNYLDDLEHSAPPVVGYPWVPYHGGQSYSSGYPSTSWYLPPQGYQEYYHSASPSAPPLPQPVQRPAHPFRQNYRRRFSLRSFMETCLEALCCCWIVELCLPWQISVMESCFNLQRIKPGATDLVCLFQRSKRVISGYMRDGIWPGFSIKHYFFLPSGSQIQTCIWTEQNIQIHLSIHIWYIFFEKAAKWLQASEFKLDSITWKKSVHWL